jgi:outer membrane receptor protein involved in Fe transport
MRSRVAVHALAVLLAAWGGVRASRAAEQDDAFALLHEEQTATASLKRPQPLSETPSSVTVISASEIRAMGYRTLGDALRWVRGLFVTYDRNYTYVGVRGLLRPGDYNNKVLLTIDGHAVNGGIYGDAYFGPELGLDMEDVERIEVVRGPGSALYGSDAVLAMVEVVTRRAHREPGVRASARAGGAGERRARASVAAGGGGRPEVLASASWLEVAGADLYFPAFDAPASNFGRAAGLDGERAAAFFGTADWGTLHAALKLNERRKSVPTASFGTRFGDSRYVTWDGHDFAELTATHALSPALELHGRAWWDGARYHGIYPMQYQPGTAVVVNLDRGDGDAVGTEWRVHWSPTPAATWTAGVEAQRAVRQRLYNADLSPALVYIDRDVRPTLLAGYLQQELRAGPALVTGGARIDARTGAAAVVSPRLDVVLRAGPDTRCKLLAGSAFRAPTPYETDYVTADYLPSHLVPERVATLEGVVERAAGPLTASLGAYRNWVRDLVDLAAVDSFGTVQFRNAGRIASTGVESELQVVPAAGNRVRLAAAWQQSTYAGGERLTNSPSWNAHLLVTHAPTGSPWSLGAGARYLSARRTLAGARTPAACVADGRLARRVGPGELALAVRNLFDAHTADPASSEHVMDVIPQDGRVLYVECTVNVAPR